MNPLAPILCAAVPAVLCGLAHYFPWRFWFKEGRVPRLLAYTIGLLCILIPATIAAYFAAQDVAQVLGLLWLAAGSAGVGTFITWGWDWHNKTEQQIRREADRAEQLHRNEASGQELYGE